jgi:hypothetical protein
MDQTQMTPEQQAEAMRMLNALAGPTMGTAASVNAMGNGLDAATGRTLQQMPGQAPTSPQIQQSQLAMPDASASPGAWAQWGAQGTPVVPPNGNPGMQNLPYHPSTDHNIMQNMPYHPSTDRSIMQPLSYPPANAPIQNMTSRPSAAEIQRMMQQFGAGSPMQTGPASQMPVPTGPSSQPMQTGSPTPAQLEMIQKMLGGLRSQ